MLARSEQAIDRSTHRPYPTNHNTYIHQEHGIDYKIPTALCTSAVNVVAIALKDKAFARMMSKEPAAFPLASYGAWIVGRVSVNMC